MVTETEVEDRKYAKMLLIRQLQAAVALADAAEDVDQYLDHPANFASDILEGITLTPYQAELVESVASEFRVAVRGPRGLGKTTLAAFVMLWFGITREIAGVQWKIVVTSASWTQLRKFLWPEVHRLAAMVNWEKLGIEPWRVGKELLTTEMNLGSNGCASFAPERPELIEGLHAQEFLIVFDESKAIKPGVFDSIRGAFSNVGEGSSARGYALAVSTPGEKAGAFYDIHQRKAGWENWHTRHVKLDECIAAGQVTESYVEEMLAASGGDRSSSLFMRDALGEFAAEDIDSVIPHGWIEAAQRRWEDNPPQRTGQRMRFGLDVAFKQDYSVLTESVGLDVVSFHKFRQPETMATASEAAALMGPPGGIEQVTVDAAGNGAGVAHLLASWGYPVFPFTGVEPGVYMDSTGLVPLFNQRTASWWNLRTILDPASGLDVRLPADAELIGDLNAPKWRREPTGKVRVEEKEHTKNRIGRSPDVGDSVGYCLFHPPINNQTQTVSSTNIDDLLM